MIFDADTHMSPYHNFDGSIGITEWEEQMNAAGIDKALAWLLPQGVTDVSDSNRYIYEQALKNPRILPFGWTNVREGLDKALRDVEKCLCEYGFIGVKLNGAQNGYYIDGSEAMAVCEKIAALGGIVAFHIGVDEPEYTDPKRAEVVAKAFPEMKVLMIHMGGAGIPDRSEEVIAIAKNNPNMYLIGSAIGIDKVADAIRELGPERVLFGSDIPFADPAEVLSQYHEMLKEFDERTSQLVLGMNAKRLFGL